jgi:hypothetical protein
MKDHFWLSKSVEKKNNFIDTKLGYGKERYCCVYRYLAWPGPGLVKVLAHILMGNNNILYRDNKSKFFAVFFEINL